MRVTKAELKGMFSRLVKLLGKENLALDHVACYGGYVVVEYGEKGSESHPFGCRRRTLKEMYSSLEMAVEALELKRSQQETINKFEVA